MGKLLGIMPIAFTYFCVGTVLSQCIGMALLASKGVLSEEKIFQILAVVQCVDLAQIQSKYEIADLADGREGIALEEIGQITPQSCIDDFRGQIIASEQQELIIQQALLTEAIERFNRENQAWEEMRKGEIWESKDAALVALRLILEEMSPAQAKDHVLRILPAGFVETPVDEMIVREMDSITAVVTIVKAMSADKRRKIIAEFEEEQDAVKLAEVLRLIRLGVPEVSLVDAVRDRLTKLPNQK